MAINVIAMKNCVFQLAERLVTDVTYQIVYLTLTKLRGNKGLKRLSYKAIWIMAKEFPHLMVGVVNFTFIIYDDRGTGKRFQHGKVMMADTFDIVHSSFSEP
ncbi:hypothetical protein MARINOS108_11339 [Marinoscillum sp. 108]|nr:hypothetical protein MARINOS108_11339 [Marinoscillum sp. 108]